MDKHFLDNMIFNLEERKDLKKVEFTQKSVIEVLGYLKELSKIKSEEQEEDRRVADLEAKLAKKEKLIEFYIDSGKEQCDEINRINHILGSYAEKIDDLTKQLAESKEEIERLKSKEKKIRIHTKRDWFERCCRLENKSIILRLENEELKQQLAEKEKENKKLKSENHALMSDNAYQEEDIFELNSFKEYYKNNTIDFAVAELEKVKEDILLDISIGIQREWISNKIDNQIKELKEK